MTPVLYMLGGIQFNVFPVNISEVEVETGADYAAKDIVGAMRTREFTGVADNKVKFSGTLFPHKFGGMSGLAALQAMAAAGQPQMLIRGDGAVFGWFVIEKVVDKHAFIDVVGVGRMIEFEIELVSSPIRGSVGSMIGTLISLFG